MYAILTRRIVPHAMTCVAIAILMVLPGCAPRLTHETVTLGDRQLAVFVADALSECERGLGGFDQLADGEGMLFVFSQPQSLLFRIKDVTFPLDVVFIAEAGTVSAIEPLDPAEPDRLAVSPGQSQYAIEVPAGWCERNGVTMGSEFKR